MGLSLNPLSTLYWGERIPKLASAHDVHSVLDVRTKAQKFNLSDPMWYRLYEGPSWVQGAVRTACFIASVPLRATACAVFGLGQLIRECPRNSIRSQLGVIGRVLRAVALNPCYMTLGLLRACSPSVVIRAQNGIDVRTASLYTQEDVRAASLSRMYGSFLGEGRVGALRLGKLVQVQGHCLGQSLWMIALFHHLASRCPDVDTRVRVIARRFASGSPAEAALIQALGAREVDGIMMVLGKDLIAVFRLVLIAVRAAFIALWTFFAATESASTYQKAGLARYGQAIRREGGVWLRLIPYQRLISLLNLRTCGGIFMEAAEAAERGTSVGRELETFSLLRDLPNGSYFLILGSSNRAPSHAIVYIKDCDAEDRERGYLFDPNVGLERLFGADQWKKVARSLDRLGYSQMHVVKLAQRGLLDQLTFNLESRIFDLLM